MKVLVLETKDQREERKRTLVGSLGVQSGAGAAVAGAALGPCLMGQRQAVYSPSAARTRMRAYTYLRR